MKYTKTLKKHLHCLLWCDIICQDFGWSAIFFVGICCLWGIYTNSLAVIFWSNQPWDMNTWYQILTKGESYEYNRPN